jgi:hypothetical protein
MLPVYLHFLLTPSKNTMEAEGAAGLRKSARHARQRFEEEEEDSSSSSSAPSKSSSSSASSSDDEDEASAQSLPQDPRNPLVNLEPQPKFAAGGVLVQRKKQVPKRSRIARPMHKGDDEGREPAKRVRRPPPSSAEEDDNGESTSRRDAEDEDEDEEEEAEIEEEDENDSDGAESLGASDSYSSSSQSRRQPATSSLRKSQRIISSAANNDASSSHDAPDADNNAAAAAAGRPPRAARLSSSSVARVRLSRCWLCTFANCKMARQISEFVSANAGTMDPAIMADQIKSEVKREVRDLAH